MAGNEWIGGYLDAILDSGSGRDETKLAAAKIGAGSDAVTAAKYFVNEVTGHDDAALYRTWIKVHCRDREWIGAYAVSPSCTARLCCFQSIRCDLRLKTIRCASFEPNLSFSLSVRFS